MSLFHDIHNETVASVFIVLKFFKEMHFLQGVEKGKLASCLKFHEPQLKVNAPRAMTMSKKPSCWKFV
jgi:hypothetical protein